MKKILLLLFAFISFNVFSQIQVKEGSFRKIDGYLMLDKDDHRDIDWKPMALIKLTTENMNAEQRARLRFKGNLETQIDVELAEIGETHLYISAQAATFLEIIHPDYGKTEYWFPMDLCDFCGYEMVVQYVPLTSVSEPMQQNKYHLIVTSDQDESTIYIDDEPLGVGQASKLVTEGTNHTYKIECELYHTEIGSVTVNERTMIEKQLRPNFGYINVSTTPEQGAKVFVNGKYLGESPIKTDRLASGVHKIRVMKDMYKMKEQSFTVNDGQTTNATLSMAANFVTLTLTVDSDSDIYVDEEYKAKGKWTGRLSEGAHIFEARKENHKISKKIVELVLGESKTITLDAPRPICGSLEINTTPMNANIFIDGKKYGQTPNYINEIIIGEHELKIEKEGYTTIVKTIKIEESKTLTLTETLQDETESALKQYVLGIEYYNKQEYSKAVQHFCKAAEQGNVDAQFCLGTLYYDGIGVTKNYSEAAKWILKAAEQGNADAQCAIGNFYYNGEGVTQNYTEAVKWYRKSAEQGVADAQHVLGVCYYKGEGVTQNTVEAVSWFRKAAEQGYAYAQGWLGFCYENGTGVTKDITKAKEWYQKSANNGYEFAKEALKNLQNTSNTQQTYNSNKQKDIGFIYGHEYVDLGLSVKWATCNIGASNPGEYGSYFAWGEVKTKSSYNVNNSDMHDIEMTDISGHYKFDAAQANWGSTWRMPTKKEFEELKDKCTWLWSTQNGVKGYKITGPNGKSIFLPAAGYREGTSLNNAKERGVYWCSSPYDVYNYFTDSYGLIFDNTGQAMGGYNRYQGFTIRPVTD